VKRVTFLLEQQYGAPRRKKGGDLLDVLVETILSQNTNDRNTDLAFQRLKKRFPQWEDVLQAKMNSVVQAIKPGGLAKQKAKRIRDILRRIKKRNETLSLDFLKRMDSEEIKEMMGSLKGIGPKTVHCLLLFGLGRESFPVDTHVLRVGKRLGFIPEKTNGDKAHPWMGPLVPAGKSLSLHINLIRFGRKVCKAIKPQCSGCFLSKECFYSSP
jgi:endonuclease III